MTIGVVALVLVLVLGVEVEVEVEVGAEANFFKVESLSDFFLVVMAAVMGAVDIDADCKAAEVGFDSGNDIEISYD